MKIFGIGWVIFFLLLYTSNYLLAQEQCGSDVLFEKQLRRLGITKEGYAKRFDKMMRNLKQRINKDERTLTDKVYKLPVVVHIIHYAGGTDYNISDEAAQAQIRLTNQHLKETHDRIASIPDEYKKIRARDVGIELHLAKRDPLGFPTTGITRTVVDRGQVVFSDNYFSESKRGHLPWRHLRPLWDVSKYLNILVVPPESLISERVSGVASFPFSDLPGLFTGTIHPEGNFIRQFFDPSSSRFFDGLIVNTRSFSDAITNPHSRKLGTTTTHELGHYLGVFHNFQWRTSACNGSGDYCEDTPAQASPSTSCSTPSCDGTRGMSENYMDYSPDVCQVMFTACQRSRMRAVMGGSPLRVNLTSSENGKLEEIVERENDLGIPQLSGSAWNECLQEFNGSFLVGNYGTNSITSVEVGVYRINGGDTVEVQRITDLPKDIPSYSSLSIPFDPVTTNSAGEHTLLARVLKVNGKKDSYEANNDASIIGYSPQIATGFNSLEGKFFIPNDSRSIVDLVPDADGNGKMLSYEMLNSPENTFGLGYKAFSPTLDFSGVGDDEALTFSFRYSHRGGLNKASTLFYVYVANDCRSSFDVGYYNTGLDLNTAPLRKLDEAPRHASEWRTGQFPILSRESSARVVLFALNGQSGNLYIDDLQIIKSQRRQKANDVGVLEIIIPEITCGVLGQKNSTVRGVFSYTNYGLERGGQVSATPRVLVTMNGNLVSSSVETLDEVPSHKMRTSWATFEAGLSSNLVDMADAEVEVELALRGDPVLENDSKAARFIFAPISPTRPPILDEGRADAKGLWESVINSENGTAWTRVESENVSYFKLHFYNKEKGLVAKLISPSVNFSAVNEATIGFNVSYARNADKSDVLQLFAFESCSPVPTAILYEKVGDELSVDGRVSTEEWSPSSASDWRKETIDISQFAGNDQIHFMFVATSDGGNNIYLDSIQISEPPPIVLSFTPEEGQPGTEVTIMGEYFSATALENEVSFGGVMAAEPSASSTTSLTVSVPTNARTGKITVTVAGQTATSANDFVVTDTAPTPAPVISSFTPEEGQPGTEVTIMGEYFSATALENEVSFGGVMAAEPSASSTTSLTVSVPTNARTSKITVTVAGQTATSAKDFVVTDTAPTPAPVISSFTPEEGQPGTEVTIMGEYFSATALENEVSFGGVMAAEPSAASTASLTVSVPTNARTGKITVTVAGQTATSAKDFVVTDTAPTPAPVISSFTPEEGQPGTEVTIMGEYFSATALENEVSFGGVMAAEPSAASTASLTVSVPTNARTGKITVTVAGQTATSAKDFVVTGTKIVSTFNVAGSDGGLRVYPNPTSDRVYITGLTASSTYSYSLYLLVGRKVLSGRAQGGEGIEVSNLPEGQYILIVRVNKNKLYTRLIVLR